MMNQANITKVVKKIFRDSYECVRCNWTWVPRKPDPIACPHCKSYEWKEKKSK